MPRRRRSTAPPKEGQVSPLAFATSLILQNPELGRLVEDPEAVETMTIQGAEVLHRLVILTVENETATTAHLLESFRESRFHGYLQTLASRENYVDDDSRASLFLDTLSRLLEENNEKRRLELLEKARISGLGEEEKQELRERLDSRTGN